MTAPLNLDALQALCDAASEGPWYMDVAIANDGHVVMSSPLGYRIAHYYYTDVNRNDAADAEFGAAAREAMPQLIAEVRRRGELIEKAYAEGLSRGFHHDDHEHVIDVGKEWKSSDSYAALHRGTK